MSGKAHCYILQEQPINSCGCLSMVEVSFWLRLLRAFGAKRKTISFRNAVLLDLGVGDNYKILLCYYILEENNNKFVIIKTKQRH